MRTTLLWGLVVTFTCFAAALVATWPLALNLTDKVLLGSEHEATTQLFTIWTLWWTADRAMHLFTGYWDAPFFYPVPGTFTFSEPEPLTGLLVSPLWALGATPAFIHNAAELLVLVLNGVFAYRLARALTLARHSALPGAVLAVTLPFVARLYGVINLVALFGIFWTLEGLVRFGREGTWRNAAWAAAGIVATYYTCQQYALMFGLFALAGGVVALSQQQFSRPALVRLLTAGVVAAVAILPVALPAMEVHNRLGLTRADFIVQKLSARPADFVTRPDTSWLDVPRRRTIQEDTGGLFPGALLFLLALAGVITGLRNPGMRRWTLFLAWSAIAATLLAMGLNIAIGEWQPFTLLRAFVPGFSDLRSVFRFTTVIQAMLAMLAAAGIAGALTLVQRRFGRTVSGAALAAALVIPSAAENLTVPVPLLDVPTTVRTTWSAWLRDQPDDTAVAHIPFPRDVTVKDYEVDAQRMFAQIDHRKPIVNGYSGYFPPGYTEFQLDMSRNFPNQGLLCELNKGLFVNTLVVDKSWLASHTAQMETYSKYMKPEFADGQVQIYKLDVAEADCNAANK